MILVSSDLAAIVRVVAAAKAILEPLGLDKKTEVSSAYRGDVSLRLTIDGGPGVTVVRGVRILTGDGEKVRASVAKNGPFVEMTLEEAVGLIVPPK